MKRIALFIALGLALTGPHLLNAQWAQSSAWMDASPQHLKWRVASQPDFGFVSLGSNGSAMGVNSFFHPASWLRSDGLTASPTLMLEAMQSDFGADNSLGLGMEVEWFSAGKFIGSDRKAFVHLSIAERIDARVALPEDVLTLPFTGNAAFDQVDGGRLDFTGFDANVLHRREWAVGLQRKVLNRGSVGARFKLLQGLHHLALTENSWSLTTDPVDWTWSIQGGGIVQSSGIQSIAAAAQSGQMDSLVGNLAERMGGMHNTGWGWDAGAEWQITDRFLVISQFACGGSITWTNDVATVQVTPYEWRFEGYDASNALNQWDGLADTLSAWAENQWTQLGQLNALDSTDAPYRTSLPNRLNLGVEWELFKRPRRLEFSAAALVEQVSGMPLSWRMSLNQRWFNRVETSVSVGQKFKQSASAGLSVGLPLGPVHVFAAVDGHQIGDWSRIVVDVQGQQSEWLLPTRAPYVAAQLGVTWRLGWRKPQPVSEPVELAPNTTRQPGFGTAMVHRKDLPEPIPCALPGKD